MSSTIEHLRIAHRLALRAQHSSTFDAAALVRTWPQVTASALAAHRTLTPTGASEDRIVERIALDARSLHEGFQRQPWPSEGGRDLALLQVAAAFDRATSDYGQPALSKGDVDEAHHLITSSLWTTSQLIGRTVRDHVYDIIQDRNTYDPTRVQLARTATDIHRRFNAVEQLAAGALHGRASTVGDVASQLRHSVAIWDIQAHRALANNRSTTVLHVLAHLEATSAKNFQVFLDQARDRHLIDPFTVERLQPVLHDSASSWAELRDIAGEFSFASTRVPATFINAATDLRERFQDTIHLASPDEHAPIFNALTSHLASAVTISAAARDLINDGELRAPARAIARVTKERPGAIPAAVDPNAIYRGLTVPLPPEARRLLDEPMSRVLQDAHEALNRTATLDALDHTPPADIRPAESVIRADHNRQRNLPSLTPQAPATSLTP